MANGFKLRLAAPHLCDNSLIVQTAARRDALDLKYASKRLLADRWCALELVSENPEHLEHLAATLHSDREVVAAALKKGFTLHGASQTLRSSRDLVHQTVQSRGMELQYAAKELCADRRIVYAAVQDCGMALQFATFQLRNERKIVEAAVKQDMDAVKYAGAHLKNVVCAT